MRRRLRLFTDRCYLWIYTERPDLTRIVGQHNLAGKYDRSSFYLEQVAAHRQLSAVLTTQHERH